MAKEEKEEEEEYELKGELDELEAEFKEFEVEFGLAEEGLEPDELEAMSELENEMDLAGISEFDEELAKGITLASLGMDTIEVQGWFKRYIKRKARRLIEKLIGYVRRHSRCKDCVRLLTEAIRRFDRGKYIAAIWRSYRTFRCMRRCLRR